MRLVVSADSTVTVDGEPAPSDAKELAGRLGGFTLARPVEISVDPRAAGASVDKLLSVLRDAGMSRFTLLVDRPATADNAPASPVAASAGSATNSDADLEVPVIEVRSKGDSIAFRIGSREVGSAAELLKFLQPLARLGGSISVRISHDGPFAHSADAIAACRDAGFAAIHIVSGEPSR